MSTSEQHRAGSTLTGVGAMQLIGVGMMWGRMPEAREACLWSRPLSFSPPQLLLDLGETDNLGLIFGGLGEGGGVGLRAKFWGSLEPTETTPWLRPCIIAQRRSCHCN